MFPSPVHTTSLPQRVQEILATATTLIQLRMPQFSKELREMCDIPSASDNPEGLKIMAKYLKHRLSHTGMDVRLVEHERGYAVVGELTGCNPHAPAILLLGHHDTVYSLGVAAPPSSIEGDYFFGPGVADMKGGLLQAIFALDVLQYIKYEDFNKIIFLSLPDEEIDHRYHDTLFQEICETYQPHVLTLESARTIGNIVVRRKGVQRYKLVAKGVPAHAGAEPEKGRSAVLELAHQIVQFSTLLHLPEGIGMNVAPMQGGQLANIVADYAEAIIEVRFLNYEDLDYVVSQWQHSMRRQLVPGVTLSLETISGAIPPMVSNEQSRMIANHTYAILKHLGIEYDPETRGGSSDGGNASALGLAVIDGFGAVGHQGHSPEEFISLSSVPHKTAVLASVVVALTMGQATASGELEETSSVKLCKSI